MIKLNLIHCLSLFHKSFDTKLQQEKRQKFIYSHRLNLLNNSIIFHINQLDCRCEYVQNNKLSLSVRAKI